MLDLERMRTIRSKYKQGNLKRKWKIQQCQCEKVYFDYQKDCDGCAGKLYCCSEKFYPFYVEVSNRMLVFADTFENAKEYACQGHGWLLERESINGMPMDIKVEDNHVSLKTVL